MQAKTKLLFAFVAGAAAGLAMGCQTYDFEPVEPLAVTQDTDGEIIATNKRKPNVMILLDKSLSMNQPTDTSDPDCPADCGRANFPYCDETVCPTRISELRSAMTSFLASDAGTIARYGLTFFPQATSLGGAGACLRSSVVDIPVTNSNDVLAELQSHSLSIANTISMVRADGGAVPTNKATGGGTPTGASLEFIGNQASMNDPDRDDLVLLLTDGLPNCNDTNPSDPATCFCTSVITPCPSKAQCLDKDFTVSRVEQLAAKGIRTIVIGFGADTASGAGPDTLNAMAEKGLFARGCPTGSNDECGGAADPTDTCQVNATDVSQSLCSRRFFQAKNAAELSAALRKISEAIITTDICLRELATEPSDPQLIRVRFNGTDVLAGDDTWQYIPKGANPPAIKMLGDLCAQLKSASEANPVSLEIRVVKTL